MLKKTQVLTMVSIMVLSFLIGTMFNTMTLAMETGGNPFNMIWEAIYDLEARVTALEESDNGDSKTWHFVTSFTLSSEEPISSLFDIEGEKWRIKWEPQQIQSWYGFIIWDENGYAIEWVDTGTILMLHHDAEGIHYVPHGKGSYYIQWASPGGPNVDFTIESYH